MRTVARKFSGENSKGAFFAVVFDAELVGTTLYERKIVYVNQATYDQIQEQMKLKIAE